MASRNNTISAMDLMWKLLNLTNDVEIDEYMLNDANNEVTTSIMYLYSMETFIYTAINRASRTQDESKVRTLGPYAVLLAHIVYGAEEKRERVRSSSVVSSRR